VIGVGVIGLGFGERVHLPGFERLGDRVEVIGGWSPSHSVGRAWRGWEDLVADPDVGLVSIASPPDAHRAPALAALAVGKAILCEKPLAVSVEDAEAMADAARTAAGPTVVDFEFRRVPAFLEAKRLVQSLGDLEELDVTWKLGTRARGRLPPSWKDSAEAGGGALLGLGIHVFDYLEWLAGPVDRARGELEHAATGATSDTGFRAELELVGGVTAHIDVSNASDVATGHAVRVRGARGELELANPDTSDYVRGFGLSWNGAPVPLPDPPDGDGRIAPFAALAGELVSALEQKRPAVPSFEHGLRAQRVAAAVRGSRGAWVDLPIPS
jgi:predicted dehydrogenase